MDHTANILKSLVPITQFNRGQASRIFDRLRTERQLVVLKNNQPAAVILQQVALVFNAHREANQITSFCF